MEEVNLNNIIFSSSCTVYGNNVVKVMNPSKEQVLRNVMNHSNPNLNRGGGCGCGGK